MTREEAIKILEFEKQGVFKSLATKVALDMAISALSSDGEYIKKEDAIEYLNDLFGEMYHVSFGNVLQSLDSLQTYSFPDSAENKGEDSKVAKGQWIKFENGYKCSECGHIMDKVLSVSGNLIYQYSNYCPECGKKMT